MATHNANASEVRDNLYLGLGVADSIDSVSLKAQNLSTFFSVRENNERHQVLGSAFVGFGYTTCNSFYFAAELGTYFPSRSLEISRPGVTLTPFTFVDRVSIQDYLTGDILLGFRPNECFLLYLRGGASYAHLDLHQFENTVAGAPSFDAKKDIAGGRVGVGVNYALTQHFGIGLDYIYTNYQSFNVFWDLFNMTFDISSHSHYIGFSTIYSF